HDREIEQGHEEAEAEHGQGKPGSGCGHIVVSFGRGGLKCGDGRAILRLDALGAGRSARSGFQRPWSCTSGAVVLALGAPYMCGAPPSVGKTGQGMVPSLSSLANWRTHFASQRLMWIANSSSTRK